MSSTANSAPAVASAAPAPVTNTASAPSDLAGIGAILQGGRLLAIVPAFALLGLGLAFTPCVLPMVPINLAIIGAGAFVAFGERSGDEPAARGGR